MQIRAGQPEDGIAQRGAHAAAGFFFVCFFSSEDGIAFFFFEDGIAQRGAHAAAGLCVCVARQHALY
jgi:hypothetical protein